MDPKRFSQILDEQIKSCIETLKNKYAEYGRGGDRLSNFKKAGRMKGETPEKALWGMWVKHLVSVMDIIHDLDEGKLPTKNILDEKIKNTINYAILLKALIIERMEQVSE